MSPNISQPDPACTLFQPDPKINSASARYSSIKPLSSIVFGRLHPQQGDSLLT